MNDTTPAGPTIVALDFAGLRRSVNHMNDAAVSAAQAHGSMSGTHVNPGAFGAMNLALGLAAGSMANRAESLSTDLSKLAGVLARNTTTLEKSWRTVEDEADQAAATLASQLNEIDGLTP